MKSANFSAYAMTALISVVFASVTGIGQSMDPLGVFLNDVSYEACGLHKLTETEAANLFRLVGSLPRYSYLEESALRHLEQDDWEPVEIYGLQTVAGDSPGEPEELLVATRAQRVFSLRLPTMEDPLAPGIYWAQMHSSWWCIMRPDGSTVDHWVEETR
jgi:hypothetical protein